MLISQRIIRDPYFNKPDVFDLRLRVMRAKKVVVPTKCFQPMRAFFSLSEEKVIALADRITQTAKKSSSQLYQERLSHVEGDVFVEGSTDGVLLHREAPDLLKAILIYRRGPQGDLVHSSGTVELQFQLTEDGDPYSVIGLDDIAKIASDVGDDSVVDLATALGKLVSGYTVNALLRVTGKHELSCYTPTKKENHHVPKNMLPFYQYYTPELVGSQSGFTSLLDVERIWDAEFELPHVAQKETKMRKKPVIWTPAEREAVALRGMELFNSTNRTLNQSFFDAQADTLPIERYRSQASLSKALSELEVLGTELYRKKHIEPATTSPGEVVMGTLPTVQVKEIDHQASVPTTPITPTPTAVTPPAYVDTLVSSAVNVLATQFAGKIEADIGTRLTEIFTKVSAEVQAKEDTFQQSLAKLTLKTKQLSELEQEANRLEAKVQTQVTKLSESLGTVKTQYDDITKGVNALTVLADKEMAKFMRLHDRVQGDLLEMQRMLEANAVAQTDAQAMLPAPTEAVAEAQPEVRRSRKSRAPADAPKVLIVGLDGDQLTILKNDFGGMLNLSFHSKDTSKKLTSMARNADYVIMSKFVDHGIYENIKDHPGFQFAMGGMTMIKDQLLEIACKK